MGQLAKTFGRQVKSLRLDQGMSQAQLAEAVNLSEEWIRRIERGEASPSLDAIEAISTALGEKPSTLLGTSGDDTNLPLALLRSLATLDDRELAWIEQAVHLVRERPGRT